MNDHEVLMDIHRVVGRVEAQLSSMDARVTDNTKQIREVKSSQTRMARWAGGAAAFSAGLGWLAGKFGWLPFGGGS